MSNYFHFFKNKQTKQAILLLITSLIVMLLMLAINYFITKILDKSTFGDYSLLLNIFNFSLIIFNFGFFHSISRMIALSEDDSKNRELFGAGLVVIFLLFVLMGICLLIYSLTLSQQNLQNVYRGILVSIPFCWVFLLNNFNELLLQGSNKIGLLSFSRFMPRFLFLIVLILFYYLGYASNSMIVIFLTFLFSFIIPYFYIIKKLKPKFQNFSMNFLEIKKSNRQFGFNIYIGSLFAVGASSLSGILIGYFGVNNTEVGYYSIALQLTTPLSLIPNVLATASFKKFANSDFIDKKLLVSMYFISALTLVFIFFFAKPIVSIIYGIEYLKSADLLYFLAISSVLYGIADFYNKFLLSKGKGTELRNASFVVGAVLLISNFILINLMGAKGATIASIISGLFYLLIIIYYFRKISSTNLDKL